MPAIEIHGTCDPRFQRLHDVFAKNFEAGHEVGASVAVSEDGEMVVDLWAGYADAAKSKPWQRDTIVLVFSTTKIMATLCALMLIDRSELDIDAPVARYWPEFAQKGKDKVLVRHIFNHSSGVPAWEPPIPFATTYDWDRTVESLAEQELWWEPGTQCGYHTNTYGFLVGELIRRVSGKMPGVFLKEEVTSKIGADFYVGLPDEALPRFAEMIPMEEHRIWGEPGVLSERVENCLLPPTWEGLECLRSDMPGANGIGNARSLARIGAILAMNGELDGHSFLSSQTIDLALTEQSYRHDLVIDMPVRYGFGMGLNSKEFECPSDRSLHWGGAGGSLVIMDVNSGTCLAYAMNRMLPDLKEDIRNTALRAAYNAIVGTGRS